MKEKLLQAVALIKQINEIFGKDCITFEIYRDELRVRFLDEEDFNEAAEAFEAEIAETAFDGTIYNIMRTFELDGVKFDVLTRKVGGYAETEQKPADITE